jgi:hypothetical protein
MIFPTLVRGDLGVEDDGRRGICAAIEYILHRQGDSGVHLLCGGRHVQIMLLSIRTGSGADTEISPERAVNSIRKPYEAWLEGFSWLSFDGHDRIPAAEILAKADKMGVKTIGDFWAACGFEKYIVRDEQKRTDLFQLLLSPNAYGRNPTLVGPDPR